MISLSQFRTFLAGLSDRLAELANPDYDESDPTKPAYIRNRPFYRDGADVKTMDRDFLPPELQDVRALDISKYILSDSQVLTDGVAIDPTVFEVLEVLGYRDTPVTLLALESHYPWNSSLWIKPRDRWRSGYALYGFGVLKAYWVFPDVTYQIEPVYNDAGVLIRYQAILAGAQRWCLNGYTDTQVSPSESSYYWDVPTDHYLSDCFVIDISIPATHTVPIYVIVGPNSHMSEESMYRGASTCLEIPADTAAYVRIRIYPEGPHVMAQIATRRRVIIPNGWSYCYESAGPVAILEPLADRHINPSIRLYSTDGDVALDRSITAYVRAYTYLRV